MSESEGFPALVDRLRAGDEGAARAVHDRWTARLIALARRKLRYLPPGREDPEDVVQSVYRSFFRRFRDGAYEAQGWDDVWAMLSVIAWHKCSSRIAFHLAARRDAGRDKSLAGDVPSRDPTPEEAAVLIETIEALFRGLGPSERAIVELSLQGYTAVEVADQLNRALRSVQRVREHVRKQLEHWSRDACEDPPIRTDQG